jgi:hypothetical protein
MEPGRSIWANAAAEFVIVDDTAVITAVDLASRTVSVNTTVES